MISNHNEINQNKILLFEDYPKRTIKRKIIFLGAPGVGKSAIIIRFKDDIFLDYYEPTIQNTYKKFLNFENQTVELEILDIDGQTEYTIFSFSKLTFGIHGYMLCYSIENRQSFELLKIIHSKLINLVGMDIPMVLLANKSDLNNRREISFEEGKALADKMNCPFVECSAKNNLNITKAFYSLLIEIDTYENNIDLKGITCRRLFEFFAKREFLMKILMIVLEFVNLIFGVGFLIFGFYIGIVFVQSNSVIFIILLH